MKAGKKSGSIRAMFWAGIAVLAVLAVGVAVQACPPDNFGREGRTDVVGHDFPNPYTLSENGQNEEAKGRGYFLKYLETAQELADAYDMEWMREKEPYKWKILVMVSEIRQEMEQEQDAESVQE